MKKIKLTQNKYALVDDDDYEVLNKLKWHTAKYAGGIFYAQRSEKVNGKFRYYPMTRKIMGTSPKGKIVDHIDGDGLNNQRKNLRFASVSQNGMNRKDNCNNVSGFRGVTYNKNAKKWQAQTMSRGKPVYLGLYKNILEASRAYQKFSKERYKKYKR
jgi:hypothetical protein